MANSVDAGLRQHDPKGERRVVLDLPYRAWAKAVVREWTQCCRWHTWGDAVMGICVQSGRIYVVQLL